MQYRLSGYLPISIVTNAGYSWTISMGRFHWPMTSILGHTITVDDGRMDLFCPRKIEQKRNAIYIYQKIRHSNQENPNLTTGISPGQKVYEWMNIYKIYIYICIHIKYNINTYIYIYTWESGGRKPPSKQLLWCKEHAPTHFCLYTRGRCRYHRRAGFVVRPSCQKQNWISMSELHGYGLHMGAGWAAESLAQGHLKDLEGTPGA